MKICKLAIILCIPFLSGCTTGTSPIHGSVNVTADVPTNDPSSTVVHAGGQINFLKRKHNSFAK